MSERSTGTRSTGTRVAVLLEENITSVWSASRPDGPSCWVDDIAEGRGLDGDTSIFSPWTTKVDRLGTGSGSRAGGDGALVDNVEGWVRRSGTAVSSNASVGSSGSNSRTIEPGDRVLSKDPVNGTLNVALGVNLVTDLSQESVLVSVETNTVVSLLVVVGSQSNGLGTLSVGVLDVDVVESSVG